MQLLYKEEFISLFQEFKETFVDTPEGQEHITFYKHNRTTGWQNFEAIKAAFDAQKILSAEAMPEDLTNQVLQKLLPHTDSIKHREQGAWIHHAPAITGDIRSWYEADGSTWEWPKIAHAIFNFITSCLKQNYDLKTICKYFDGLTYTKNLQSGMLTPILNAVWPDEFLLINRKSQRTIGYFAGTKCSSKLVDYPKINELGKTLIKQLAPTIQSLWKSHLNYQDQFDMFCHWLVAIKQHPLISVNYWKISPGEDDSQWKECCEEGFIALEWPEFGNLSGLKKREFDQQVKDVLARGSSLSWGKSEVRQLWDFSKIQEGDRIVANRGTEEVLGIGTVTGAYYYQGNTRNSHRLPVQWDDLTVRSVNQLDWRKTLVKLNIETFDKLQKAEAKPAIKRDEVNVNPDCPFSEKTFDLLSKLNKNPQKVVYDDNKQAFKGHLEDPFQRLMLDIAERLPNPISELMETRSRIFAKILKNDWGQGGAWDFYWGAFYPKGGKRTEDAQLFLWIGFERLECGFYIGRYGSEQRQRFLDNCKTYQQDLIDLLQPTLDREGIVFGSRFDTAFRADGVAINRTGIGFREWITDPSASDIHVAAALSADQVLSKSQEDLTAFIQQVYEQVFPLVLLATFDEPMAQIQDYLEPADDIEVSPRNKVYTLAQCSADTHLEESLLEDWVQALNRKGQAILYGPPGTGKTYLAEHLAKHLLSDGDGFVEIVQFHPAYTYEDFIQGIRPKQGKNGGLDYPIEPGRFLSFCYEAQQRQDVCVLIIDEINRANLAQVFGELMYLLEYRDKYVKLACGGQHFSIPKNVRIIGTMNTADRSIALVDHALRRRFAFLPLYPQIDVLRHYHASTGFHVGGLIDVLKRVNETINDPQYAIGTSFFLHQSLRTELRAIWRMEIEPYLEEYFFDQPEKVKAFKWDQVKSQLMP
jgi:5-methylcytosine-specific restriction enzyme B